MYEGGTKEMTEGRKIIVIPKVEAPAIDVSTGERKKKRVDGRLKNKTVVRLS